MMNLTDLNLDCMDQRELEALGSVLAMLREYAYCKSHAMAYRKAGNINEALGLEARCERIYKDLPEEYKW